KKTNKKSSLQSFDFTSKMVPTRTAIQIITMCKIGHLAQFFKAIVRFVRPLSKSPAEFLSRTSPTFENSERKQINAASPKSAMRLVMTIDLMEETKGLQKNPWINVVLYQWINWLAR
ncbi:MAG: hypothetical protein ACI84R_003012, partial [Candidatus Azotimanducaceae bacterium]